ncbi:MAG: Imm8 family immunity protein [Isosphaeraceae bacterium]
MSDRPENRSRWFTVSVSPADSPRSDLFQGAVATPQGVKSPRDRKPFAGLVVERFEALAVDQAIRARVATAEGPTWEAILKRLQTKMRWEYEGMGSPGIP